MPIDFTGIDTSGIYGGGPSASSIEYVLQLLEPYGITDVSQIQGMSDAQIQALINQVVNANTGVNPDSSVYTGSGMTPPRPAPVMDTTGLPMGYARDPASGQVITEQQWRQKYGGQGVPPVPPAQNAQTQGYDQQSAQNLANAAAGGSYTQKSDGKWYDAEGREWNPNEGMPQDILNAYMLSSIPGGLENAMSGGPQPYSDYLTFKDPATGQARPVPPAIQALAADPNTDIIAMEDGYYLSDPAKGTTSKYAVDGSVVYETKVDAGGNYVTSYANGAKTLVTKNGWRTDYDNTGKVLVHKYQGDPRPDWKAQAKSGDPRAMRAARDRYLSETMGSMQNALGSAIGPDGRPRPPQNQERNHSLPAAYSPGTPATPGTNINATFGGLGYSGPVEGRPGTPPSNGVPQNPELGSIDPNDPTVWKRYVDENGIVQTKFDPSPTDPRFDLTDKAQTAYNNSPEGRAAWQQREMNAAGERSSREGDLQASGMTEWGLKHQNSIPPDDTPGYGNNPPSTTGVPPAAPPATGNVPPGPPATTPPPPVRPPGVMPPGDVRAMPYPGRPFPTKTPPPGYGTQPAPTPAPRPIPQWQQPHPWEVGKTPPPGYPSAWLNQQPPASQPPAGPPQAGIGPRDVLTGGGETRNMPGGTRPTSYSQTTGQQGYGFSTITGTGQQGGYWAPPPDMATMRDQLLQRYSMPQQQVMPTGWGVGDYGRQMPMNAPSSGGSTYAAPPAPVTPAPTPAPAPVAPPPVQPPLSITNPTSPGWNTGGMTDALRVTQPTTTTQQSDLLNKMLIQPPKLAPTGTGWRA